MSTPDPFITTILAILLVGGFITLLLLRDRPSSYRESTPAGTLLDLDPLHVQKLRHYDPTPAETESMRDIVSRPAVEAILAAWTYDGPDYFVTDPDWRTRRELVRGAMPILARNLDRLVRDWDDRHLFAPVPAGGRGVRVYDHLPPVEAVARSWEEAGRSPGYHRNRRREVSNCHPVLAHSLNRFEKERKDRNRG